MEDVRLILQEDEEIRRIIGEVTPRRIRAHRDERYDLYQKGCGRCQSKEGLENKMLKMCSRCKLIWYCSRECQKQDWPNHRSICEEREGKITKLLRNLSSNPYLFCLLGILLSLAFNLRDSSDTWSITHSMIRITIGVEPCDREVVERVYNGEDPEAILREYTDGKIPGMLQINDIMFVSPDCTAREEANSEARERVEAIRKETGESGLPIEITFFYTGSTTEPWSREDHSATTFLKKRAIEIARDRNPLQKISTVEGKVCELPMTEKSMVRVINDEIRLDRDNQYLLRTDVELADLKVISNLGKKLAGPRENSLIRRIMSESDDYIVIESHPELSQT